MHLTIMDDTDKTYRIFISAAEPSADAHCAGLINALKQSGRKIEFVGIGGAKMESAGCKLLEATADNAVMIYNAFSKVFRYFLLLRRITKVFKSEKIDLVIVCDSPAFNFHVAKAAKKAGIKTLFYVAPQLWAWADWRIKKLRKWCDKLACILPFEQDWFGGKGVDTTYVGNPLLDELDSELDKYKKTYKGFKLENVKIAIMPGSRSAEINSLWPEMQAIAARIRRKYPDISLTTVAVDEKGKEILRSMHLLGFKCSYAIGSVAETAREADFSIVASGSATLQVAAVGCPMVIMYQSSKLLWHVLGRWLVKTKYFSLVNILADRKLVPEFMPYFTDIGPITESIEQLLANKGKLVQVSKELTELATPLRQGSASEKVARIVTEMLS